MIHVTNQGYDSTSKSARSSREHKVAPRIKFYSSLIDHYSILSGAFLLLRLEELTMKLLTKRWRSRSI